MAEHASPHEPSTSIALAPPTLTPSNLYACFYQGDFQNSLLAGGKALLCNFDSVRYLSVSLTN